MCVKFVTIDSFSYVSCTSNCFLIGSSKTAKLHKIARRKIYFYSQGSLNKDLSKIDLLWGSWTPIHPTSHEIRMISSPIFSESCDIALLSRESHEIDQEAGLFRDAFP